MNTKPNVEIISSALAEDIKCFKIYSFETIGSTNTTLKQYGADGAEEGTTILSFSQSGGRGRHGRTFFSPTGTGVYLSTLIRPSTYESVADRVTSIAAVSACEAIESVFPEVSAKIKWVNDVFVENKKVCGILSEAAFSHSGTLDYVVVGVGINLYPPKNGFPAEISETAGFIAKEKKEFAAELISAEFLNKFYGYYHKLPDNSYQKKYSDRCFVIGKTVDILRAGSENGETVSAEVLGIDDDCRLIVKHEGGMIETLSSGEVRLRSW